MRGEGPSGPGCTGPGAGPGRVLREGWGQLGTLRRCGAELAAQAASPRPKARSAPLITRQRLRPGGAEKPKPSVFGPDPDPSPATWWARAGSEPETSQDPDSQPQSQADAERRTWAQAQQRERWRALERGRGIRASPV